MDEGETPAEQIEEERRYPSTIGGAFYLIVLAVVGFALVVVALGRWRTGIHILAGSLGAAAVLRLMLPQRDAGMLAVRNRFLDAAMLAGVGALLYFLASTIPDQM